MKRLTKLVALGLAIALLASSCGDDASGGANAPADDPLVQALVEDILAEGDDFAADRGEAECFARGVVGSVGTERLNDLGVTVENVGDIGDPEWTEAEAGILVDNMFECTSAATEFSSSIAEDATDEQAACVADAFDEDAIRSFFVNSFTSEEPDFSAVFDVLSTCGIDAFG